MGARYGLDWQRQFDSQHMRLAIDLARRGQGFVEPNPMVGCVIARGADVLGQGWHARYGEAHAEVEAIGAASGAASGDLSTTTLYVTLEPCCHHGKTPPCTELIIRSGIRTVVMAGRDPFPSVDGGGIRRLEQARIQVITGVEGRAAQSLKSPYFVRLAERRPWVHAKWAMTLDGKIATKTYHSQWISGESSRAVAHRLRGRMDAILVGSGTALADDPLLTARPPGPRLATRIVLDRKLRLSPQSRLVQTAGDAPVLIATLPSTAADDGQRLRQAGCEVFFLEGVTATEQLLHFLENLADRGMTNLLVEGGSQVLGSLLDASLIDEVHVFVAPLLIGGDAVTAIAGNGKEWMADALRLESPVVEQLGSDVYLHGRVNREIVSPDSASLRRSGLRRS